MQEKIALYYYAVHQNGLVKLKQKTRTVKKYVNFFVLIMNYYKI